MTSMDETSGSFGAGGSRRASGDESGDTGSNPIRVQIISRPGCHLCEAAEVVVAGVCAERGVGYEVLSIEDDHRLADEHAEYIPVILVDGARHDFYRVDATRLRAALDR